MSGLSVGHRVALAALLARCSGTMLKSVSATVAGLPGGKAADLRLMLAEEMLDRKRRASVFAPIAPMFALRADGLQATTFPAFILARLWKAASSREPDLLVRLDEDGPDADVVANRICRAAASIVRDQPDLIWPAGEGDQDREAGLVELATFLDLSHLARRALPSIDVWLKRPDGDQLAELRLLVKDCSDIHPDGAWRFVEMLFAHLEDAVLVLRILIRTSGAAGQGGFLSASEMSGFVDRLLTGINARVARLSAYRPGQEEGGTDQVLADLEWCANVLAELDVTLTLDPQSAWGKSVRESRVTVAAWLAGLFRTADKAVDKALPLVRVQTSGRMTRMAPQLDAPARGEAAEAALALMKLVGATRGATATFGCESERKTLTESLSTRLSDYADQVLISVNDGEAPDEAHALKLVSVAARFLELIDAKDAARAVRRRAAVAGGPGGQDGASSRAA